MYLGVIVAAAGALMLFQTWAMVFFLPMSFIIFIRAWQEDKLLAIVYKDEWEEYTEKVGKWWPRKPR
jgi:protein-S-isoprenylcysteine O-methyltransferase Ste14